MQEFIMAALPWVLMGISIAVLAVNGKKGERKENYITEGMCLGMCAGITVSTMGMVNIGIGITLGMLAGEAIGCLIKKEEAGEQ